MKISEFLKDKTLEIIFIFLKVKAMMNVIKAIVIPLKILRNISTFLYLSILFISDKILFDFILFFL